MNREPVPGPSPCLPAPASDSRRFFLKTSGALAASALSGVILPPVHAAEDNTLRIGMVGCGGRGTGAVLDAVRAQVGPVKLTAMGDLFQANIDRSLGSIQKAAPASVDVPPDRQFVGFDAYKRTMDALNPGDIVILATQAAFRPLHFEYAVNRGLHVFAEKSFAPDGPATRRWLRAAEISEQKKLVMGCGYMWRHSKARQEVVQRIHDGALGDLHTLRIYRMHGPADVGPKPAQMSDLAFQLQNRSRFNWLSGGFFVDWQCHNVDVACWVKGEWPVHAEALGGRTRPQVGNLFDHYAVEYTFADGAKLFANARHMPDTLGRYSDYAHGTKGSAIIMNSLEDPAPRIFKGQNMTRENMTWEFGAKDPSPYVEEWKALLNAVRNDLPHNEARRAGESNFAVLMGRAAAHSGQRVTMQQMMASNFEYIKDIDQLTMETPAPITADADGRYPAPIPGVCKDV